MAGRRNQQALPSFPANISGAGALARRGTRDVANINVNRERALTQSPSTNRAEALQMRRGHIYMRVGDHISGREKVELIAGALSTLY